MAKTMFDPAQVLGKRIVGMSQQGVCEFASKLCGCIEAQVGSQSYRGGIFPENISVDEEGNIGIGMIIFSLVGIIMLLRACT